GAGGRGAGRVPLARRARWRRGAGAPRRGGVDPSRARGGRRWARPGGAAPRAGGAGGGGAGAAAGEVYGFTKGYYQTGFNNLVVICMSRWKTEINQKILGVTLVLP
ncbi:hypothetical protein JL36_13460, partial [Lactococcus cremoris]